MKIELKKFDYIIIATVVLLAILTACVFFGKHKIAKTPVVSENTIVFQVVFRGATITDNEPIFKPMEESFITIRNVPHKKVTILSSSQLPRLTTIADAKGKEKVIRDVSNPFMYDCLVTLYDDAKITDDGAVVGGNKLKIGLPIVLEGKNYRFTGTLSNIKILNDEEAKNLKQTVEIEKAKLNQIPIPSTEQN